MQAEGHEEGSVHWTIESTDHRSEESEQRSAWRRRLEEFWKETDSHRDIL